MNAQLLAKSAYSAAAAQTRTGRAIEYDLLARVTHGLKRATEADSNFSDKVRALHDNRALWTTLAADVAVETNELPRELRARIFYLHEFTTNHSRRVLAGDADLDVLIDINTAVLRGLESTGAGK